MLEMIVGQMVMMGSWGLEAIRLAPRSAIAFSRWMIGRERRIQQQQHQEEELETHYISAQDSSVSEDVEQSTVSDSHGSTSTPARDPRLVGWEFKIVRAKIDLFWDAKQLQKLCEEEAQAGWILLEKLDDHRVRFKRPIAIRDLIDISTLQFDPYRCHYGPKITAQSYLGAIALMGAVIFPAGLGYVWVNGRLSQVRPSPAPEPVVSPVAEPFPARPLTSTPWQQNQRNTTD